MYTEKKGVIRNSFFMLKRFRDLKPVAAIANSDDARDKRKNIGQATNPPDGTLSYYETIEKDEVVEDEIVKCKKTGKFLKFT